MSQKPISLGSPWNNQNAHSNFTELYTAGIAVAGMATDLVALAAGGQSGATALSYGMNNVITCATAGDSVKLPTAVEGYIVRVKNSGATAIDIFPFLADSVDALAVNLAVRLDPGGVAQFHAISATVWESDVDASLTLNAPTTAKGNLRILAADNDGETITTLTNAAMGQASVISIPDPGAAAANVLLTDADNDGVLVTATAEELNAAADVSAWGVTYTVAQAEDVAVGIKDIIFEQGTGDITATIADAVNHAGWFSCKAITEPDGGHTLTLTSGTFDGSNNVATFADALDALVVYFDYTGNGVIISNTGAVVLS